MISKEMYVLLKKVPRHPNSIAYEELKNCFKDDIYELMCEAKYEKYEYVNVSGALRGNNQVSLTEKGQAAVEEYEQAERNQQLIKSSLTTAKVAMWAAIGSAIAAIVSLIKMFC